MYMPELLRLEALDNLYIDALELVMAPRGKLNKQSIYKVSQDMPTPNDAVYEFGDLTTKQLWRAFFKWSLTDRAGYRFELYVKRADNNWHKQLEDFIDMDQ